MVTRFIATLAILVGFAASLHPPKAEAQDVEITGPLAGAPAVMGLRIYREGRFQFQPHAAMTLQDEFTRTVLVGAQLNYHLFDWLGLGVWGSYGVAHIDTALTDEVQAKGQTTERNVLSLPNPQNFPDQIGKIKYIVAPQLSFIPLRGKLGLFEKLFVDTDFYLFGGVAVVGIEERDEFSANTCLEADSTGDLTPGEITCFENSQDQRATRTSIAPTFGAGLSLYVADFVALTVEWRGMPFAWNTSGFDEASAENEFPDDRVDSDDRLFHFNHMVSVGFAFYLPASPKLSH